MTVAENRLAHLRLIVEREANESGLVGSDRQRYRAAYQTVAALVGTNEEYVYQLFKGKKPKMGDAMAAKLERAYRGDRNPGWIDFPPSGEVLPSASAVTPVRPPTTDEAIERLADLLMGLDDDGREMASTALSRFARNPANATKLAETLDTLARIHEREPQPDPPSPSRKRTTSAGERRSDGKTPLTVKEGGGRKVQMALPFRTVADPWDHTQAPANERAWYAKVKAAPKAKN